MVGREPRARRGAEVIDTGQDLRLKGRRPLHRPAITVSRERPSRPLLWNDNWVSRAKTFGDARGTAHTGVTCGTGGTSAGYRLRVVRRLALAPVLALLAASLAAASPAQAGDP